MAAGPSRFTSFAQVESGVNFLFLQFLLPVSQSGGQFQILRNRDSEQVLRLGCIRRALASGGGSCKFLAAFGSPMVPADRLRSAALRSRFFGFQLPNLESQGFCSPQATPHVTLTPATTCPRYPAAWADRDPSAVRGPDDGSDGRCWYLKASQRPSKRQRQSKP